MDWGAARRHSVDALVHIFLDDNRWQVPHPKNDKPYDVPLTPEVIEILRSNTATRGKRHVGFSFHADWTGHVVDLKWRGGSYLRKQNSTGSDSTISSAVPSARNQALQGTSLTIIGGSLGHKSLAATQVYAQINLDPVRASVMSATRTIIAASKKKPKQLPSPKTEH